MINDTHIKNKTIILVIFLIMTASSFFYFWQYKVVGFVRFYLPYSNKRKGAKQAVENYPFSKTTAVRSKSPNIHNRPFRFFASD